MARPFSFVDKASGHVEGKLKWAQRALWKPRNDGITIIQTKLSAKKLIERAAPVRAWRP